MGELRPCQKNTIEAKSPLPENKQRRNAFFDSLVTPLVGPTVATPFLSPRVNQMSSRLDETAVIAGLKTLQGWQLASDDEQRTAIEKDVFSVADPSSCPALSKPNAVCIEQGAGFAFAINRL